MSVSMNHNVLSEFPFYNLDPQEFIKITGGWVHHSYHSLIESKDLFRDIIISPEKNANYMKIHTTAIFNQTIIPLSKLEIIFIRRIGIVVFL